MGRDVGFVIAYLGVIVAAVVGGLLPGLLATSVVAIWEAIGFLPPDGPAVGDPTDQARLALFVLGGVLMSALCEQGLRARVAAERARNAERLARLAAERSAGRATTLAELSAALNMELTRVDIAHEALRRSIRAVGAARGAWFVPDETGTALRTAAVEGYPEAILEDYRRVSYDAPLPAAEAARTLRPVLVGTAEQYHARYPGTTTLVPQAPTVAMAAQPLIAEGRLLGVLGWAFTQEQAFDAGTAEFLDAIGSLTAQALQSAAAFEGEQGARRQAEEANRRLDVIVGAGQALGATLDYETTLVAMARAAIPYLGEVCAVDILEDGGVRRSVATAGDAFADIASGLEAWPVRPGSDHPIAQAMREERTIVRDVEYGPPGEPVEIRVSAADRDGVEVRVLDRGPGVADPESEAIFAPFYRSPRTARVAGGAGIGLFVCRRLVEAMSGRIWARPREGGGSEFGFWLPRYVHAAGEEADDEPNPSPYEAPGWPDDAPTRSSPPRLRRGCNVLTVIGDAPGPCRWRPSPQTAAVTRVPGRRLLRWLAPDAPHR